MKAVKFKMFVVKEGFDDWGTPGNILLSSKRPEPSVYRTEGFCGQDGALTVDACSLGFEKHTGLVLPEKKIIAVEITIKPIKRKKKIKA